MFVNRPSELLALFGPPAGGSLMVWTKEGAPSLEQFINGIGGLTPLAL